MVSWTDGLHDIMVCNMIYNDIIIIVLYLGVMKVHNSLCSSGFYTTTKGVKVRINNPTIKNTAIYTCILVIYI